MEGEAWGGGGKVCDELGGWEIMGEEHGPDLAGDEGGVGGEAWGGGGGWAREAGKGEMEGPQRAVWEQQGVHWFHLLGSLKNLTIGLIWLVTRGGRWGGAPESSVGATKGALVPLFLTIGLVLA